MRAGVGSLSPGTELDTDTFQARSYSVTVGAAWLKVEDGPHSKPGALAEELDAPDGPWVPELQLGAHCYKLDPGSHRMPARQKLPMLLAGRPLQMSAAAQSCTMPTVTRARWHT